MKPLEFLVFAVVLAVLDISHPSLLYVAGAHVMALCGCIASFSQWNKDQAVASQV